MLMANYPGQVAIAMERWMISLSGQFSNPLGMNYEIITEILCLVIKSPINNISFHISLLLSICRTWSWCHQTDRRFGHWRCTLSANPLFDIYLCHFSYSYANHFLRWRRKRKNSSIFQNYRRQLSTHSATWYSVIESNPPSN